MGTTSPKQYSHTGTLQRPLYCFILEMVFLVRISYLFALTGTLCSCVNRFYRIPYAIRVFRHVRGEAR